jgi:hypothetical protein
MRRRIILFLISLLALGSFLLALVLGRVSSRESLSVAKSTQSDESTIAALANFDVRRHGFKFENYGGEPNLTNLTALDMQRMFGDQVCSNDDDADSDENSGCLLTPPAEEWMESANHSMGGGHCEGMAALSLLLYSQQIKADQFGAAHAGELQLANNPELQREIAYWYATQMTQPTRDSELKSSPDEVVEQLIQAFQEGGSGQLYSLGIYQRDMTGGHAMTPYGVKDLGNGKVEILVYDNNHPGVTRVVKVDRTANTWEYYASTNPDEPENHYEGDRETATLTLTPTPPRTELQDCPFCAEGATVASAGDTAVIKTTKFNQLWIEGDGQVVVTDAQGRRLGLIGKKLVEEIPGAHLELVKGDDSELWEEDEPPVFYLPRDMAFQVTIGGKDLKQASETSISLIGPGYDLTVDEIALDPGQTDTIQFAADGRELAYKTESDESPTLTVGFESRSGPDYEFDFTGVDLDGGGTIRVKLNPVGETVALNTQGTKKPGTYEIVMNRLDTKGEQVFFHDDIGLNPGDTATLNYGKWLGDGKPLPLGIDRNGDGKPDETLELTDDTQT